MGELVIGTLCLAGFVFAASAAAKLRGRQAYRSFRIGLRETVLVPRRLLPAVAAALVSAEALVAAGLIAAAATIAAGAAPTREAAAFAELAQAVAALLTVVLAAGVAAIIRSGTKAHCACFGSRSARPLGWVHLSRNIGLLAAEICGLVACPLSRPPTVSGSVVAAVAGGVAALLIIRADDLADLFGPAPPAQARHAARAGRGAR
jgi:Methylamine utilisation protein MauE